MINLLFVIAWSVLGFFALRYLTRKVYPNSTQSYLFAGSCVGIFIVTSLWPDNWKMQRIYSTSDSAAAPAAQPLAPAAAPVVGASLPAPTDLSAACKPHSVVGSKGQGSIDGIYNATANPQADLAENSSVSPSTDLTVRGWAAEGKPDSLADGVCVIVDGQVLVGTMTEYGFPRPDVAKFFQNNDALLGTGYLIKFTGKQLKSGLHLIEVGVVQNDGSVLRVPGHRSISVN